MNIEIVCSSYSKNSKLWRNLIESYKRNAPELLEKYKFTIISDACSDLNRFLDINYYYTLKKDYGWSHNLIKYLHVTKSEYILIIFDDVFLTSKINITLFNQLLEEFFLNNMSFCRLRNSPLTLKKRFNSKFNLVDKDSPYRTVLSFSIVKKEVLLSLLESKENAWEYEYNSPSRSSNIEVFEIERNIISYIHVIEKGGYRFICLFYKNLKFIRANYNLFVPSFLYLIKFTIFYLISKMPYFIKRIVYNIFSKLVVNEDYSSSN